MEIKLPVRGGPDHVVCEVEIKMLQDAYPGVDVVGELKKMAVWCRANPQRRKTSRGINRFIASWLARQPAPKPVAYAAAHKPFVPDDKPKQITPEKGKSALAELKQAMRGRR